MASCQRKYKTMGGQLLVVWDSVKLHRRVRPLFGRVHVLHNSCPFVSNSGAIPFGNSTGTLLIHGIIYKQFWWVYFLTSICVLAPEGKLTSTPWDRVASAQCNSAELQPLCRGRAGKLILKPSFTFYGGILNWNSFSVEFYYEDFITFREFFVHTCYIRFR